MLTKEQRKKWAEDQIRIIAWIEAHRVDLHSTPIASGYQIDLENQQVMGDCYGCDSMRWECGHDE